MTKIVQNDLLSWLAKETFELQSSDLIFSRKSIWGSIQRTFPLKDVSPSTGEIVMGNKSLDTIGWAFFAITLGTALASRNLRVPGIFLVLGLLCFAVRFMFRSKFVVFENRNTRAFLFSIKDTKDSALFIQEVKAKISSTH
jgi:hypothetical protein